MSSEQPVSIKLERILPEECGVPRNDGTPGSALYLVVIKLDQTPPHDWDRLFVHAWDNPSSWSTMHRRRIASVSGDRILLDGTTIEEVNSVHKETLRQAVDTANAMYNQARSTLQQQVDLARARELAERERLERLAKDVKF